MMYGNQERKKGIQDKKAQMHERIGFVIRNDIRSCEDFAYELGYNSKGTIGKWCSLSYDTIPDAPTIIAIAELCGVDPDYLLCLTDDMNDGIEWDVNEDTSHQSGLEKLKALSDQFRFAINCSSKLSALRNFNYMKKPSAWDAFKTMLEDDASTKNQQNNAEHS